MKLALFIFALGLSLQGWCASVTPSLRTTRTVTPEHEIVAKGKLKEEANSPLPLGKMKAAMVGWGLLTYLIALFWWAITAKHSLDKILKDVLQDIGQYSS